MKYPSQYFDQNSIYSNSNSIHSDLPYTALIVDDEQPARDLVKHFLNQHPAFQVVAECASGVAAVNLLQEKTPDIVFLDIQIPDLNGFEVLKYLETPKPPVLIFITAYDQYALRAFDAHAVDYLLKPYSFERFNQALNKALFYLNSTQNSFDATVFEKLETTYQIFQTRPNYLTKLVIKEKKRLLLLQIEQIQHILAADDYVEIFTTDGKKHLYADRLSRLEAELDPTLFLRIHRSIIVNRSCVSELRPHQNGEFFLVMNDQTLLKTSRTYKEALRDWLK